MISQCCCFEHLLFETKKSKTSLMFVLKSYVFCLIVYLIKGMYNCFKEWMNYFNMLFSSFFFFLNSMNSYFVFYWIVKLLWFFFFFAMLLGACIWYLHHIHVLDWLDIKTVSHHLIKALNCHILKQTAPSSKKIYSLRKRFFPFLLGK